MAKINYLLIAFLVIVGAYSLIHTRVPTPDTIDFYAIDGASGRDESRPYRITGTIVDDPDERSFTTHSTIEVDSIFLPPPAKEGGRGGGREAAGRLLVSTFKYPRFHFGDQVSVFGKLEKPQAFEDFDYPAYLSLSDIYAVMRDAKIELIPSSPTLSPLHSLRHLFESQLQKVFPLEPQGSLMAGLLLGSRKNISPELKNDFQKSGLSHIIAISGFNITLVLTLLLALFKPLGKKTASVLSALGLILFTLLVGAGASVVRACIMGLIALLAFSSQRKRHALTSLLFAAVLMSAYQPEILLHDISFQLSFLATLGLIVLSPLLEPYFLWIPKSFALRDSILLSLSAQIMTVPIILLNFHTLSLVSPLSNILIAGPLIPATMLIGAVSTALGFFSITVAKLIGVFGQLLLSYLLSIIHLTASLPFSSVSIPFFSISLFLLYYLMLGIIIVKIGKEFQKNVHHIRQVQLWFRIQISAINRKV